MRINATKTPRSVKNMAKLLISVYTLFHRKAFILEKNCTDVKNIEKPLMPTHILFNRRRFTVKSIKSAITVKKSFRKYKPLKKNILKSSIRNIKGVVVPLLVSQILLYTFVLEENPEAVAPALFNIMEFILEKSPANIMNL